MKTLRVYLTPALKQGKQFQMMCDKMKYAITKLNNTSIKTQTIYLYFNSYLIKIVYFGYSIVEILE